MSRSYRLAPIASTRSLVVPLKGVPKLPWKRLLRVLPGLLDAQVPMDLEGCATAFSRNGNGVVGLIARREDLAAAFEADPALQGALPEAWLLWKQALREGPAGPSTEALPCAVLYRPDATRVVIAMGRGTTFETSVEVAPTTEAILRSLRMAFGADAASLSCLCCGHDSDALAESLRTSPLHANARVSAQPELWSTPNAFPVVRELFDDAFVPPAAELRRARIVATWRIVLGLLLLALAIVLGIHAFRIDGAREKAERRLDLELTHRVDTIVGYPVTARGDRAVALAREAASKRDTSILDGFLKPSASATLADSLEVLRLTPEVTLSAVRIDRLDAVLSGNAPQRDAVQAFLQNLQARGFSASVEFPQGAPGDTIVRFMITARRTSL